MTVNTTTIIQTTCQKILEKNRVHEKIKRGQKTTSANLPNAVMKTPLLTDKKYEDWSSFCDMFSKGIHENMTISNTK